MYNINKIFPALFIVLFLACSNQNTPEAIVNNYYQAILDSDFNQAYQYLSKSDQESYSSSKYVEMRNDSMVTELQLATKKTEFSINQVNVNKSDMVTVLLDIKSPDVDAIIAGLLLNAFSNDLSDTSKINDNISKMLDTDEVKYKNSQKELKLVLEDNEWRINEGLEIKKKKHEIAITANLIINDGKELISNQNYDEANKKIMKIFELDKNLIQDSFIYEAENLLATIELINQLEIYDLVSRYINVYSNKKEAGIRFKIKNNSGQDLSKVKVKVYYLDSNGNRIHDKSFTPVLVSEYSFGRKEPLKAGYIYQMPERQFYTSESVPNEWDEGNVTVSITEVEVME